ncbi:type IX secretion system outer membrane channel protein PorV [Pedobacter endophyticus]|uniref:Type IX secretion system outer membrane channel protein PorV n=1 Tax=Pedobacter endophyticus TaxID=2789740 RepID=A0A7S9KYZ7_9SPHI|nr:type IX secretion system outer membrane channel protein PorV [Pedobacter endophyticus]QPH39450.1 type IX secretion system outer membrane channel protein PorV [Pedobacter endophyticus]
MNGVKYGLLTAALLLAVMPLCAQTVSGVQTDGTRQSNIVTAVPFLLITPQARAGAMGNAGVALDAGADAPAINMAALAFLPTGCSGVSLSYSPWLKTLVPDMSLGYLSGYYRLSDKNTIAASFRYFSLGAIQFTDSQFQSLGTYNPNELALDVGYSRNMGPDFAMGGTLRFIYSNLYSGQFSNGGQAQAGKALAADVSAIYKREVSLFSTAAIWSAGINLSNIGTKVSYSTEGPAYFLPANFKIGTAVTLLPDNDSRLSFALDLHKLMAPTQPIYDADGNITSGKDPNRSVPAGIFGSFADAPGGFGEEMREIGISTGFEYSYQQKFALRAGYNYQDPQKGNSRYLTLGAGFKYNIFNIDFSYLAGSTSKSPLANTLRFTLQANFGQPQKK